MSNFSISMCIAAVAVNDKLTYAIVELKPQSIDNAESSVPKTGHGKPRLGSGLERPQVRYLVVAADLVSTLQEKWKVALDVKGTFPGSALEHSRFWFSPAFCLALTVIIILSCLETLRLMTPLRPKKSSCMFSMLANDLGPNGIPLYLFWTFPNVRLWH